MHDCRVTVLGLVCWHGIQRIKKWSFRKEKGKNGLEAARWSHNVPPGLLAQQNEKQFNTNTILSINLSLHSTPHLLHTPGLLWSALSYLRTFAFAPPLPGYYRPTWTQVHPVLFQACAYMKPTQCSPWLLENKCPTLNSQSFLYGLPLNLFLQILSFSDTQHILLASSNKHLSTRKLCSLF